MTHEKFTGYTLRTGCGTWAAITSATSFERFFWRKRQLQERLVVDLPMLALSRHHCPDLVHLGPVLFELGPNSIEILAWVLAWTRGQWPFRPAAKSAEIYDPLTCVASPQVKMVGEELKILTQEPSSQEGAGGEGPKGWEGTQDRNDSEMVRNWKWSSLKFTNEAEFCSLPCCTCGVFMWASMEAVSAHHSIITKQSSSAPLNNSYIRQPDSASSVRDYTIGVNFEQKSAISSNNKQCVYIF